MHITLRQLRAALAVGKHLSFRQAAEIMHVSQPALSNAIAELEQQLGLTLFDRTSRSVAPTQAGMAFLQGASRIIHDVERLMLDTHNLIQSRRGKVVVASVSSVSGRILPFAIKRCAAQYPELEVEVRDDVATQVLLAVRTGEVDFALTVEPASLESDMCFDPLMEDPFFVVCSRTHKLARQDSASWKDLEGENLITLSTSSGMHQLVHNELTQANVSLRRTTPVSHLSTVHGMLEADFGISVLPALALPISAHPTLTCLPLRNPELSRVLGIYRRRDRSLSPAAQGLLENIHLVLAEK